MLKYLATAAVLFLAGTTSVSAQNVVSAEYVNAKLPIPASFALAMYVRNDSIYLFGGYNGNNNTQQILRYNIETDVIEEVARLPYSMGETGSLMRYNREIYYSAGLIREGQGQYTRVLKFDPATNTVTEEGRLTTTSYYHTSFKVGDSPVGYFLTIDRDWSTLSSYDLVTKNYTDIKNVGEFFGQNSVVIGNYAYIFGVDISHFEGQVLRIDLTTLEHQLVSPGAPYHSGNVVTDAFHNQERPSVYAFGRADPSGNSYDEIIKFDPAGQAWNFLEVEGLLTTADEYYLVPPSSVYAEHLNRIYYFGGKIRDVVTNIQQDRDEIWYIDLNETPRTV